MGRRFAFCPNCNRFSWARTDRKTGQSFCMKCGEEIPSVQNISMQPDSFSVMEDHNSYPKINKTGGLK